MFSQFFKTLSLSAALALAFVSGTMAQEADPADQTAPGVQVTNTISLTYNGAEVGGEAVAITLPEVSGHSAVFTVARKIDLSVTAQTLSGQVSAMPGAQAISFNFTLRNLGNGTQGYNINVTNTNGELPGQGVGLGDTFEGLTYSAIATTTPGAYYVQVEASDYDTTANTNAGDLAPGETLTVRIFANIPDIATDGLADLFEVTAISLEAGTDTAVQEVRTNALDSETPNVVFADAATEWSFGGTPANPGDAAINGQDADRTNLRVIAPVITANKTAAVVDENRPESTFECVTGDGTPNSGTPPAAVPGACVEYTITVTNNSSTGTDASNIVIKDPIPANTQYAGFTLGAFNSVSFDGNEGDNGTVTATLETLANGNSAEFRIRVIID